MKKVLSICLLATAFTTTAFASPVPVRDINAGYSSLQLDYGLAQNVKGDNGFDVKTDRPIGIALDTALTDTTAVQYSYSPVKTKDHTTSNKDGEYDSTNLKLTKHQLIGVYKYNDNLNLYGGVDYTKQTINSSGKEKLQGNDKEFKQYSTTSSKNKLGIIGGVTAHTKLADNLSAFADIGLGSVTRYDAKLGVNYDLTSDLSLATFYETSKTKLGGDEPTIKQNGLNLAVNYKF